jgi:hypothetical protein
VDDARRNRARVRQARSILRKGRVSDGEADLSPVHGAEALSLVTRLTRESWALSRQAMPRYARAEIPVRFVPRRDA